MIGLSAAGAVGFALICIFAGRLSLVWRLDRNVWRSLAGGVATAYVFVFLLPELSAHHRAIEEQLFQRASASLYALVLLGTCFYYGLEVFLSHSEGRTYQRLGFWAHTAGFSLYYALIGYFLLRREDQSVGGELIYFLVLGLHAFALDIAFREQNHDLYDRYGRWVMAGSVLAGWAIGVATIVPDVFAGMAFALLAGGMILNVLKQELPAGGEGRYLPFIAGATICTALLMIAGFL
ncbi:hypothetical protein [Pelagibacterium limicola]|uniref:hypothetical protein n=1 Tax=Pelagibacterium limicola TaxID=2791022 RepID=UPI0018AF9BE8|nr:hypothetical protein [Pelagibacterium limicola]